MRKNVLVKKKKSQQNKTKKQGIGILTSDNTDLSKPKNWQKYGR